MKKVFAFGLYLEVEDWVKYLAVDANGNIYGYEKIPREGSNKWFSDGPGEVEYIYSLNFDVNNFNLMIVGV